MQLREAVENFLSNKSVCKRLFGQDYWEPDYRETLSELGITSMIEVEAYGGEGQGEDYWIVYLFKNDTDQVYVKFDGYYYSYNGATYSRWFYVTPKQVIVTQYFKE